MRTFRYFQQPRKRTVAGDLLLGLAVITVLLIVLLGAAYYFYMDYSVSKRLKQDAQRLADVVSQVLEQPMFMMDNEATQKIAEVYISSGRVAWMRIETPSGDRVFENLSSLPQSVPWEKRDIRRGDLLLGHVVLAFDDSPYVQAQQDALRTAISGILFMLFVNIISIRWLLRSILMPPLALLGERLQQIAGGTYEGALQPVPQQEINVVVNAVNRMANEIAERTRRIAESEKNYREIFNSTSDAIIIHDIPTGAILDANRAMLELYGYTREELSQLSLDALRHNEIPLVTEDEKKYWVKAVSGIPQVFLWHAQKKNGEQLWVEVGAKRTMIGSKEVVLVVVRDISDRIRLEAELHQAQKMEALGTLAGGIAHDFNNILSGIMGYTDLAKIEARENPKLVKYLTNVENAAIRARDLIRQILTFTRKGEGRMDVVSVAAVVTEALKLLRSTIPVSIDIVPTIDARPIVYADPSQIHQVIMNLCTNAYHAMEETGGTLSVHVSEMEVTKDRRAGEESLREGCYAAVEVSDTGIGMNDATRAKIFDPYFTTKKGGKGSGLGLAVVHGIVHNSGGTIVVQSKLGSGTVFRVLLPVTDRKALPEVAGEEEVTRRHLGRILFIDDEEAIRGSAAEFLTRHGFTVTVCSNGEDGLSMLQQHAFSYDLLITDMAMPGMSGLDLARKVRSLSASLPIILCSGYSADIARESFVKMLGTLYLQKPLLMGEMLSAIHEALATLRAQ